MFEPPSPHLVLASMNITCPALVPVFGREFPSDVKNAVGPVAGAKVISTMFDLYSVLTINSHVHNLYTTLTYHLLLVYVCTGKATDCVFHVASIKVCTCKISTI